MSGDSTRRSQAARNRAGYNRRQRATRRQQQLDKETEMLKNNGQVLAWATESKRTPTQLRNAYIGLGIQPAIGQQGAPAANDKVALRTAVVNHLNGLPANQTATYQPPAPARTTQPAPAPVPVRNNRGYSEATAMGLGLLALLLLAGLLWALFLRPAREVRIVETRTVVETVEVEKEVIKTVEVIKTLEVEPTPRPTEEPEPTAQPRPTEAPVQPAGICNAYKIDYTHGDGVPLYTIDAGSPREREIVNLWVPGEKETTYIFPRMTVIRALFKGYGNMWKFPQGCDFENLVERAVSYAKDTTSSNHTGKVYLVNADGSFTLITDDAFNFDLSNLPVDPTK